MADSMVSCDSNTGKDGTCSYPDAARSVHLWWRLPHDVTSVTNEVCVKRSCPGTYFCIIGFKHGYSGIQELYDGRKKLIFSVWDSSSDDDPTPDKRVKVLYAGPEVEVSRFGNEGTGGKTMMPYQWKNDYPIRFRVTAECDENKVWTCYSCYVYDFEKDSWFHIASLQTITNGDLLKGIYSFVEDFRRDKASFHESRKAHFGDCIAISGDGHVTKCTEVHFTGDNTPADNIDAGIINNKFFLETGAQTKNANTKLNSSMCCN